MKLLMLSKRQRWYHHSKLDELFFSHCHCHSLLLRLSLLSHFLNLYTDDASSWAVS